MLDNGVARDNRPHLRNAPSSQGGGGVELRGVVQVRGTRVCAFATCMFRSKFRLQSRTGVHTPQLPTQFVMRRA